ncbi:MAG: hypothetical protein GVY30_01230 [Chloroflexi bacterium]|nr:hypothetical protein [Chloroflexota bacterium]
MGATINLDPIELHWIIIKIHHHRIPKLIPAATENLGPYMGHRYSMVEIPTHPGLIEPDPHNLL